VHVVNVLQFATEGFQS